MRIYVLVDDETQTPLIAFRDKETALHMHELFVDALNLQLSVWLIIVVG